MVSKPGRPMLRSLIDGLYRPPSTASLRAPATAGRPVPRSLIGGLCRPPSTASLRAPATAESHMLGQSQSPLQPMVDKLAYWATLDTYWGEFTPEDAQALLNLPHRTKRLERHGYIVRERE